MAAHKRWRTHTGQDAVGRPVTWTVKKYLWRGPCTRSPWSEKNIRPIIVQDDKGLYRVGMRNAYFEKPHMHEVSFSPHCYSSFSQAAIAATADRLLTELIHEHFALNAQSPKAPQKAEKQRNVIRMRR